LGNRKTKSKASIVILCPLDVLMPLPLCEVESVYMYIRTCLGEEAELQQSIKCQICRKICALLGYYITLVGSSVPTFRDNLSVPSSVVKKSRKFGAS
jgi:hypothetical protein